MEVTFEKSGNAGIFTFSGDLTSDHENDLKLLLMKAVYSVDHAVLNFRDVSRIDDNCRNLIRKAYCISVRLRNSLIITQLSEHYSSEILNCNYTDNINNYITTTA